MFLWVKAFHLISVVTWFAALFYLPRLFVYHAMTDATDTAGNERFKIMERKLLNGIMTPSMILAVALGIWMLITRYFINEQMFTPLSFVVVANTFLIGLVLTSIGLIALYIGNIHAEVANRPLYIIRERINFD